jgi:branched-chain amino acid transport system substrate-binding protein
MPRKTVLGTALLIGSALLAMSCGGSVSPSSNSSAGPIVIGGIFTLSGANAASGQNFRDGAQAAVNRINAKGGVLGRPLQLSLQDSAGTPTGAAAAVRELAQEKVVAMLGDNFSADVTAEAVIANEVHIPLFSSATANALFAPNANPYLFGAGENSSFTAQVDATYMVKTRHITKPCVIDEIGVFGTSTTDATSTVLGTLGLKLTATQSFPPGATDVSVQLHALRSAGCDGVFIWAPSTPGIGAVARSMVAIGWQPPSATTQSAADAALVGAVGVPALANFYGGPIPSRFLVAQQGDKPSAAVQQYLDDFAKARGISTLAGQQLTAAYMYDAVQVISQLVAKANSTDGPTLKALVEKGGTWDGVRTSYSWTTDKRIGEGIDSLGTLQGGIVCTGPCVAAPTS